MDVMRVGDGARAFEGRPAGDEQPLDGGGGSLHSPRCPLPHHLILPLLVILSIPPPPPPPPVHCLSSSSYLLIDLHLRNQQNPIQSEILFQQQIMMRLELEYKNLVERKKWWIQKRSIVE